MASQEGLRKEGPLQENVPTFLEETHNGCPNLEANHLGAVVPGFFQSLGSLQLLFVNGINQTNHSTNQEHPRTVPVRVITLFFILPGSKSPPRRAGLKPHRAGTRRSSGSTTGRPQTTQMRSGDSAFVDKEAWSAPGRWWKGSTTGLQGCGVEDWESKTMLNMGVR